MNEDHAGKRFTTPLLFQPQLGGSRVGAIRPTEAQLQAELQRDRSLLEAAYLDDRE